MDTADALSLEFEAALSRSERRRLGVFNTPLSVARSAVASLIEVPGTVCDPSCGTGTFLVAAVERLRSLGVASPESLVRGVDIDPAAVAVARSRVPGARIEVGDGLELREHHDYIVGNPPFVDRLHARFLELATRIGGAVAMVVPTSLLATNDGRVARASGFGVASFERVPREAFDADVDTCVLVLRRDAPVPAGPTWASLLVSDDDVPVVALGDGPTLGASCTVVAGFRQHYYGLRGAVAEGGPTSSPLRLVTSGSIDVGGWSGRPVRFDGVRYDDPRVALPAVADPAVRSWFESLLVPKVVVATQTRVLEAAVDGSGCVVPSVPVISVVPSDPSRVWHVLAVLLAPPVTAWALRRWAGTALTPTALKLGAPNVRSIPVPSGTARWDDAASVLRDGGDVDEAAALACAAYGVGEEVHGWWQARREARRR